MLGDSLWKQTSLRKIFVNIYTVCVVGVSINYYYIKDYDKKVLTFILNSSAKYLAINNNFKLK